MSPQPDGSTSRVQMELRLPHAVESPIEYGFHSAPGAVMSIASVGARQNAVFSLRTIWVSSAREQRVPRELLEVPVLMSRAGVVHQVACRARPTGSPFE